MKSMIFAAGLGTRLKPLTDHMPKALIPVAGKPLLEHVILKLRDAGSEEIIINIHHFPQQIIDFVESNNQFGIHIAFSDEQEQLLETGGGVRKAEHFLNDGKPFFVHNADILSNTNLKALYAQHQRTHPLATLVVSERDTFRYLLFDDDLQLRGWINEKTGELKPEGFSKPELYHKLAFSGIQVLSPGVFELMRNFENRFSITDFYLSQVTQQRILGYVQDDFRMIDVGKTETLSQAEAFFNTNF
jgi:NDP-sugar pyrophosphorylase family protein